MKNNEVSETKFQNTLIPEQISGITEINPGAKIRRNLRKIIAITSIAGIAICFSACTATGYVATEPTYVEHTRPPQPSNLHVWINGDWVYSSQNHVYVQNNGYWAKPNHNRTYIDGYWKSSPQGKYWVSGHYQRNRY